MDALPLLRPPSACRPGVEAGRSYQPAQRVVGSQQEQQGRRLVFNELKFTETTKAQIAELIEHVNLSGTTPAFIPEPFDVNAKPGDIGPPTAPSKLHAQERERRLDPDLPGELAASITAQYVERIIFARCA